MCVVMECAQRRARFVIVMMYVALADQSLHVAQVVEYHSRHMESGLQYRPQWGLLVDHLISLLSSVDLKSCIEVDMCIERE